MTYSDNLKPEIAQLHIKFGVIEFLLVGVFTISKAKTLLIVKVMNREIRNITRGFITLFDDNGEYVPILSKEPNLLNFF